MRIARRIFVVPLADNNHGKTSIIRSLLSQAEGYDYQPHTAWPRKDPRIISSPWGREINCFAFPRSYQETEKYKYNCVSDALYGNDPLWRSRELIIMPSHVEYISAKNGIDDDIDQMIEAAHGAGFDIICASVLFDDSNDIRSNYFESQSYENIQKKNWDERWTIPNKYHADTSDNNKYLSGQLDALGRDLWVCICRAISP